MINPPPIASQIELQILDLDTLEKIGSFVSPWPLKICFQHHFSIFSGDPLVGHQGYTPTDMAFYLYLDVSENYVASGSEDNQGVIWDRTYKTIVK